MQNSIKLQDINSNTIWIETKVQGDKKGWTQTELSTFTGKTKMIGKLGEVMSFTRYLKSGKKMIQLSAPEFVSARIQVWNKETKENELFNIIF